MSSQYYILNFFFWKNCLCYNLLDWFSIMVLIKGGLLKVRVLFILVSRESNIHMSKNCTIKNQGVYFFHECFVLSWSTSQVLLNFNHPARHLIKMNFKIAHYGVNQILLLWKVMKSTLAELFVTRNAPDISSLPTFFRQMPITLSLMDCTQPTTEGKSHRKYCITLWPFLPASKSVYHFRILILFIYCNHIHEDSISFC